MPLDDDAHGATERGQSPAGGKTGRPRQYVPPKKLPHLPLDQPLRDLSPTARSLLEAGRRILEEKSFRALTLEAVAYEAGTSKSTLVEQFGNRATFLAILFDSLMQEVTVELLHDKRIELGRDEGARIESIENAVESLAGLYEDVGSDRAYFEILAMAMHDEALRMRLATLQRWYRELRVRVLSRSQASDVCTPEELALLGTLLEAAENGLSLNRAIDPEASDMHAEMALLGRLIALFVRDKSRGTTPAG